jgi:integrase
VHDLIPIDAPSAGALAPYAAEFDAIRGFAENAKAAAPRRAYRCDMAAFTAWCTARGLCALPATPQVVAWYLSAIATTGLASSSIGRRLAGIRYHHEMAGFELATGCREIKTVMAGIRRTLGSAPRHAKTPATAEVIEKMLATCPDTLLGRRDSALIAVGFAGALRRSELAAIRMEHLTWTDDGVRVLIPRSKGDQEGRGQEVGILRGVRIRPVQRLRDWLDVSGIVDGWVFRSVAGGRLSDAPMAHWSIAERVKRRCKLAGYDPAMFSGHSLRSGYITSAAETRADIWRMAAHSRHKSLDTLRGYVRSASIFESHSGAGFL